MNSQKLLNEKRMRRARRVRAKTRGTASKPRLSVFRSNKYISVQLIDDVKGTTLASVSSRGMKKGAGTNAAAEHVGKTIAEQAKKLGISHAVLDRGKYKFHGNVKALVSGAKSGGLTI